MPADLRTARDEIYKVFRDDWIANTPAVTPGAIVPEIRYQGVGEQDLPPQSLPYARIFVEHTESPQGALAPKSDRRRYDNFGIVTVQIFTPLELGEGLSLSTELAKIGKAAFQGATTASDIWFFNVVASEVGVDGPHFQWNVVADFRYTEFS